jgi:hypothetical protein
MIAGAVIHGLALDNSRIERGAMQRWVQGQAWRSRREAATIRPFVPATRCASKLPGLRVPAM